MPVFGIDTYLPTELSITLFNRFDGTNEFYYLIIILLKYVMANILRKEEVFGD